MGWLSDLSVAVSVIVIICMTAAFAVLFILYCFSKKRVIETGGDDEKIAAELKTGHEKYVKAGHEGVSVSDYLARKNKTESAVHIILNVVFGIVLAVIFALTVTGLVFRAQGERLYIGGTAFVTVQTGSMSEKSVYNSYYEYLPDDGQIAQYSLVGINKVAEEDLKQFDIIAYEHEGVLYIHRLVEITERDGVKSYTAMGDANDGSFSFEINMPFDKIEGVYSGYQSRGMGAFLSYIQSETGIVAVIFALCLVLVADLAEDLLAKRYKERYAHVAAELDKPAEPVQPEEQPAEETAVTEEAPAEPGEQPAEPEPQPAETVAETETAAAEEAVEEAVDVAPAEIPEILPEDIPDDDGEIVVDDGGDYVTVLSYRRSFTAKLVQLSDETKSFYSELKNEILSYKGAKSRVSRKFENFKANKKLVISMRVRGKTLCLLFALDFDGYEGGKYKVEKVQGSEELPCIYRIISRRRVAYAKKLIAAVMSEYGVEKGETPAVDYVAELAYKTNRELLEEGLIKIEAKRFLRGSRKVKTAPKPEADGNDGGGDG